MSDPLQPHGLQYARLPCPWPSPRACSNLCPLSRWCHPTILSSVIPSSSCLQSFPASRSFPMSRLFTSGLLDCLHFFSFPIFCFAPVISTILFSRSFICASASIILLWIPSGLLFISVCLFFSSCRSLVNISQSLPPFFFQDPESYSLSLFWIPFLEGCFFPLHLVVFLGFYLYLHLGLNFLLFHADKLFVM